MDRKELKVKELARLAGVSVRTLHHYDAIGLLRPSGRTEAGYRLYERRDLLRLQQILLYRELGMPLETIRRTLDEPGRDPVAALREQRGLLARRLMQTEAMVRGVDEALRALESRQETELDMDKLFGGFDPARHEAEARERWGGTDAWQEAARRTRGYRREDWTALQAENDAVLDAFAVALQAGTPTNDEAVATLVERHRRHIDRWFYPCSPAMHAGLAGMYVADERFSEHFDKRAPGLAAYISDAILTANRDA